MNESFISSVESNKLKYTEYLLSDGGLSDDFKELFTMQSFSGVILSVSGKEFKAHKAILSVRSEVFAAMFMHNMKDKTLNRVEIQDVNQEVMEEMLKFIYTGKTTNLDEIADELLAVADKYAIKLLKLLCEVSLYKNLKIENVAEVLVLADLHSSEYLKSKAFDFL